MKGINGFNGKTIAALLNNGDILQGQTYPITIIMKLNGSPISVIGYKLYIRFNPIDQCKDTVGEIIDVNIPVIETTYENRGTFSGHITSEVTSILKPGLINVSVKYTDASNVSFINDMAECTVFAEA